MEPVCFDWLEIDNTPPKNPVYMVIADLSDMPFSEIKNFGMGGVHLDFRGYKKTMQVPEKLRGNNPVSALKRVSIDSRRENLQGFKDRVDVLTNANPDHKIMLSDLCRQITFNLNCGKEPVLLIKGHPTQDEVENLALITENVVYIWVFEDDWKGLNDSVAKAHQFNSELTVCSEKDLPGTALLFNYSKNAYDVLSRVDIKSQTSETPEIWGVWTYRDINKLGGEFLRRKALAIPYDINEWLWSGGNGIIIGNLMDSGMFFNDLTSQPTSMYYTLKRAAGLFDGNPEKIIANLTPANENELLDFTHWSAVNNANGIITILVTSKYETNKEVKLTCPVPFTGKTNCTISTGFVNSTEKDTYLPELKTEEKLVEIQALDDRRDNGLFEMAFCLSKCMTIRLVKEGAELPVSAKDILTGQTAFKPEFDKGILQLSMKHPSSSDFRSVARCANGVLGVQGARTKDAVFGKTETPVPKSDDSGENKILADYATFDLYAYKFEFEEDTTTHASIEGHLTDGTKVQEGGKDKNFVGIYGSFSDTPKPIPTKTSISIFFSMSSNGAGFLADPEYPLAKELQVSGERRYDIYLNVGDAQDLDVTTSVNWGTIVDMTPTTKPPVRKGSEAIISFKDATEEIADVKANALVGDTGLIVTKSPTNPAGARYEGVGGRKYIGIIEAGVAYFDSGAIDAKATANISAKFSASLTK